LCRQREFRPNFDLSASLDFSKAAAVESFERIDDNHGGIRRVGWEDVTGESYAKWSVSAELMEGVVE
jgi:hypothetical protein